MTPKRRANGEGTIYRYRNGYAASVFITTPSGERRRKTIYGKTRPEVHSKFLALQARAKVAAVAPSVPKLGDYLDRWLRDVVNPNLAPTTASNYELFGRLYIRPDLGERRIDRLSVAEVQRWVNALRRRCQCCAQGKDARRKKPKCCAVGHCCEQRPSDWTVHQAWTVLSSALGSAVREELIVKNVASLVRVSYPRPKRPRPWTVDEARRFLEAARAADDSLYVVYVLILVLGLRRGEALALRWSDVDLVNGELHIRNQLQRVRGQLLFRPAKTAGSEAPLPLPEICHTALLIAARNQRTVADRSHEDFDLVTTTRTGGPVDPRGFNRRFNARCKAADVPLISVHTTRRTCASMLVAMDVHPRTAMQILRHSQIAVTMNIYSESSSASTREALRRLGASLESISFDDDGRATKN